MNRHWTLDLVALSGMCAGFALFVTGSIAPLSGVVAAGSAYALLIPELSASGRLADHAAKQTPPSTTPRRQETTRQDPAGLQTPETAQ